MKTGRASRTKGGRSNTSSPGKHGEKSLGGSAAPARTFRSTPSLELAPSWERSLQALATRLGLNARQLVDEWYQRALARVYDGQDNAEVRAYEDILERLGTAQEAA